MKIIWNFISEKKLPEWVIKKFYKHLDLSRMIINNKMPYEVLDSKDDIDWLYILKSVQNWSYNEGLYYFKYCKDYEEYYNKFPLRLNFIKNHKDQIPSKFLFKYCYLDEEFLNSNLDIIDWEMLSENYRIKEYSADFLLTHLNDFNVDKLMYSHFIPMSVVIAHPSKFNLYKYYIGISMKPSPYSDFELSMFKNKYKKEIQKHFCETLLNS